MKAKIKGNWHYILVSCVIAFFLINNIFVISNNEELFRGDSLDDYIKSVEPFESLKKSDFSLFARNITSTGDFPLFYIFTIPFYFIEGRSQFVAGVVSQIYLAILLLGTYKLGEYIWDRKSGILCAVLAGSFPLIYSISRVYQHQFGGLALLPISILMMLKSDYFTNLKYAVLFGIFAGLGMLHRDVYAIFLAGPFLTYILRGRSRVKTKNLLISILIPLFLVLTLFIPAGGPIMKDLNADLSKTYSAQQSYFSGHEVLYYFSKLPQQVSPILSIVFLFSLFSLFIYHKNLKEEEIIILAWFVLPLLFYTFVIHFNKFWAHTLLYMPSIALIICFGLRRFKKHSTTIMALVGALAVSQFLLVSYWPYHGIRGKNLHKRISGVPTNFPATYRKVTYHPRQGGFNNLLAAFQSSQVQKSQDIKVSYLLGRPLSYSPADLRRYEELGKIPDLDICANPKGFIKGTPKADTEESKWCKNSSYMYIVENHDVVIVDNTRNFRELNLFRYRTFGEKTSRDRYEKYKTYYETLLKALENKARKVYNFEVWKHEFKIFVL